jgi:hypothetical protein
LPRVCLPPDGGVVAEQDAHRLGEERVIDRADRPIDLEQPFDQSDLPLARHAAQT